MSGAKDQSRSTPAQTPKTFEMESVRERGGGREGERGGREGTGKREREREGQRE